ncbi:hypothetical protein [Brevibacterium antiquum]|uniref:hypothetical protein n=1 Tax=Brevibacterium antiquum TaxID=234835 RepID=UPI0018DF2E8F|nr:hypothetical protein [Brevibacterium antiquum]
MQNRIGSGVPDGGQYAETAKTRPSVGGFNLADGNDSNPHDRPTRDFLDAGLASGRLPIGPAYSVSQIITRSGQSEVVTIRNMPAPFAPTPAPSLGREYSPSTSAAVEHCGARSSVRVMTGPREWLRRELITSRRA